MGIMMMPIPKPRIDALTTLRFFAAALIVLGHAGEMGIPGYQGALSALVHVQPGCFVFLCAVRVHPLPDLCRYRGPYARPLFRGGASPASGRRISWLLSP